MTIEDVSIPDHGQAPCGERGQSSAEQAAALAEWSTNAPPRKPGTYISVRAIETYRWLPYKPDGARQMLRKGRWQKFDGYGFTNAEPPEGAEWRHLEDGKDGDQ